MGLFDDIIDNVGEPHKGGGKGFTYGTHEVVIGESKAVNKKTKASDNSPVIEIVVLDPADEERKATCTLYFHTDGGAKMAVTKVLGLLVHKAGEDKKEQVRALGKRLFASIDDPKDACDVANKLINDKLIGERAFLVAEPQGKYKTTSYGDIWHYEAKPEGDPADDTEATAKDVGGSVATDIKEDDIPDFDDGDL